MQRAVSQESQTTRVRRHVAANLAAAFGAQIERHHISALGQVIVERLEDTASIAHESAGGLVEAAHPVHAAKIEHDFIVHGHVAADEACTAALGYDGQAMLGTDLHDAGHFLRRLGPNDACRVADVLAHPVLVVRFEVRVVDDPPLLRLGGDRTQQRGLGRREHRGKLLQDRGRQRRIGRVAGGRGRIRATRRRERWPRDAAPTSEPHGRRRQRQRLARMASFTCFLSLVTRKKGPFPSRLPCKAIWISM